MKKKLSQKSLIKIINISIILLVIILLPKFNTFATEKGKSNNIEQGVSEKEKAPLIKGVSGAERKLSKEILLQNDEVLVLNASGKYIISPSLADSNNITQPDWEAASNTYNETTKVKVADNAKSLIRTLGSGVKIQSIYGNEGATLRLVEDSNLSISTQKGRAVDIGTFSVGENDQIYNKDTILNITSPDVGISIYNEVNFFPGSKVNISAGTKAILFDKDKYLYSGIVYIFEDTNISANVSGSEGIAIEVLEMHIYGGTVTADAPNGIGGVSANQLVVSTTQSIIDGETKKASLIAKSLDGKAIKTIYSLDASGAKVHGITQNGDAGISSEYSIYANGYHDSQGVPIKSDVYGSAKTGFGIIGQSTFDNSTFPNGQISIDSSKLEGHVEEGMGISTYTSSIYGQESEIVGTADKGIGISLCSIWAGDNASVTGISHGSTPNHYQVYDSIPDSVGINALSALQINGNANVKASAPISDPESYGIHIDLPYESGYSSGSIYAATNSNVESEGGTGIYTSMSIFLDDSSHLDVKGDKLGTSTSRLNIMNNSSMVSKSENGPGLNTFDILNQESLVGMDLNATMEISGKDYGIKMDGVHYVYIDNGSQITSTATSSNGIGMMIEGKIFPEEENWFQKFTKISNSSKLTTTGQNIGLKMKDMPLIMDDADSEIKATGGETAIDVAFENTANMEEPIVNIMDSKVIAISQKVAPDAVDRSAVVVAPKIKIKNGILTEVYDVIANSVVKDEPTHTKIVSKNIKNFQDYDWSESDVTVNAHADGISSPNTSMDANFVAVRTADDGSNILLEGGKHRVQLHAIVNLYDLKFDTDSGTPLVEDRKQLSETKITEPTGITKTGHMIEHWINVEDGSVWDFDNMNMPKKDMTLKLVWKLAPFNVMYDDNTGGDVTVANMPATEVVLYSQKATKPATVPTRTGYDFVGWFKDSANTKEWNFDTETMPANDVTLYAKWKIRKFTVKYDSLGGKPNEQAKEVQVGQVVPEPEVAPTKRAFSFTGWFKDEAATIPWNFGDVMPDNEMTLYAGWQRTHWQVFLDASTGNPNDNPESILVDFNATLDLSPYLEGGQKEFKYAEHGFLGWTDEAGNPVKSVTPTSDVYLTAKWIHLSEIMKLQEKHIPTYKNVEVNILETSGLNAQYKNLYGEDKSKSIGLTWNSDVIKSGGVERVKYYVNDVSGKPVYGNDYVVLYVLNEPYISLGNHTIFIDREQQISNDGREFYPVAIAEIPNFKTERIDTEELPIEYSKSGVDTRTPGDYYALFNATFTDFRGKVYNLSTKGRVKVWADAEPNPEDVLRSESQQYWLAVNSAIHLAKPGETWVVDEYNYKQGGTLEYKKIPKNSGYDRLIIAEPNRFLYMGAAPLNRLAQDKDTMLEVRLDGSKLNFHSKNIDLKDGSMRDIYPLHLDPTYKDNDITNLVGENKNQMQLKFDMNHVWYGTPLMSIKINDELKSSVAGGANLYMFHYNDKTNELEFVGKMNKEQNDYFSIPMKEVREKYVIVAEIPKNLSVRVNEKTNPLDEETKKVLIESIVASGRTTGDDPIAAITTSGSSISKVTSEETKNTTPDNKVSSKTVPIVAGASVAGLSLAGLLAWILKKRRENNN